MAIPVGSAFIDFKANFSELEKRMAEMEKTIKSFSDKAGKDGSQAFEKIHNSAVTNINETIKEFQKLRREVEGLRLDKDIKMGKLTGIDEQISKLKQLRTEAFRKVDTKEIMPQVDAIKGKLAELRPPKGGFAGYIKEMGQADTVGKALSNTIMTRLVAPMMAIEAIGAITGALQDAVKTASEFELRVKEIGSILSATQKATVLPQISDEIKRISEATGQDATKVGKAIYDNISSGVEAGVAGKAVEKQAELAIAGVADVAATADLSTTIVNSFNLQSTDKKKMGENLEFINDILFQTVKLGKTTVGELSQHLATLIPNAKSAGISLQDVGAAVTQLTLKGVKTPEAVVRINRVLSDLQDTKVLEGLQKLGVQGIDFVSGKVSDFSLVLDSLAKKNLTGVEIGEIFKEERSAQGIKILLERTKQGGTEFSKILKESFTPEALAGGTNEAFDFIQQSADQGSKRLTQTFETLKINIGSLFLGGEVKSGIAGFIDGINQMMESWDAAAGRSFALGESFENEANMAEKTGNAYIAQVEKLNALKAGKDGHIATSKEIEEQEKKVEEAMTRVTNASPILAMEFQKLGTDAEKLKGAIGGVKNELGEMAKAQFALGGLQTLEGLEGNIKTIFELRAKAQKGEEELADLRKQQAEAPSGTAEEKMAKAQIGKQVLAKTVEAKTLANQAKMQAAAINESMKKAITEGGLTQEDVKPFVDNALMAIEEQIKASPSFFQRIGGAVTGGVTGLLAGGLTPTGGVVGAVAGFAGAEGEGLAENADQLKEIRDIIGTDLNTSMGLNLEIQEKQTLEQATQNELAEVLKEIGVELNQNGEIKNEKDLEAIEHAKAKLEIANVELEGKIRLLELDLQALQIQQEKNKASFKFLDSMYAIGEQATKHLEIARQQKELEIGKNVVKELGDKIKAKQTAMATPKEPARVSKADEKANEKAKKQAERDAKKKAKDDERRQKQLQKQGERDRIKQIKNQEKEERRLAKEAGLRENKIYKDRLEHEEQIASRRFKKQQLQADKEMEAFKKSEEIRLHRKKVREDLQEQIFKLKIETPEAKNIFDAIKEFSGYVTDQGLSQQERDLARTKMDMLIAENMKSLSENTKKAFQDLVDQTGVKEVRDPLAEKYEKILKETDKLTAETAKKFNDIALAIEEGARITSEAIINSAQEATKTKSREELEARRNTVKDTEKARTDLAKDIAKIPIVLPTEKEKKVDIANEILNAIVEANKIQATIAGSEPQADRNIKEQYLERTGIGMGKVSSLDQLDSIANEQINELSKNLKQLMGSINTNVVVLGDNIIKDIDKLKTVAELDSKEKGKLEKRMEGIRLAFTKQLQNVIQTKTDVDVSDEEIIKKILNSYIPEADLSKDIFERGAREFAQEQVNSLYNFFVLMIKNAKKGLEAKDVSFKAKSAIVKGSVEEFKARTEKETEALGFEKSKLEGTSTEIAINKKQNENLVEQTKLIDDRLKLLESMLKDMQASVDFERNNNVVLQGKLREAKGEQFKLNEDIKEAQQEKASIETAKAPLEERIGKLSTARAETKQLFEKRDLLNINSPEVKQINKEIGAVNAKFKEELIKIRLQESQDAQINKLTSEQVAKIRNSVFQSDIEAYQESQLAIAKKRLAIEKEKNADNKLYTDKLNALKITADKNVDIANAQKSVSDKQLELYDNTKRSLETQIKAETEVDEMRKKKIADEASQLKQDDRDRVRNKKEKDRVDDKERKDLSQRDTGFTPVDKARKKLKDDQDAIEDQKQKDLKSLDEKRSDTQGKLERGEITDAGQKAEAEKFADPATQKKLQGDIASKAAIASTAATIAGITEIVKSVWENVKGKVETINVALSKISEDDAGKVFEGVTELIGEAGKTLGDLGLPYAKEIGAAVELVGDIGGELISALELSGTEVRKRMEDANRVTAEHLGNQLSLINDSIALTNKLNNDILNTNREQRDLLLAQLAQIDKQGEATIKIDEKSLGKTKEQVATDLNINAGAITDEGFDVSKLDERERARLAGFLKARRNAVNESITQNEVAIARLKAESLWDMGLWGTDYEGNLKKNKSYLGVIDQGIDVMDQYNDTQAASEAAGKGMLEQEKGFADDKVELLKTQLLLNGSAEDSKEIKDAELSGIREKIQLIKDTLKEEEELNDTNLYTEEEERRLKIDMNNLLLEEKNLNKDIVDLKKDGNAESDAELRSLFKQRQELLKLIQLKGGTTDRLQGLSRLDTRIQQRMKVMGIGEGTVSKERLQQSIVRGGLPKFQKGGIVGSELGIAHKGEGVVNAKSMGVLGRDLISLLNDNPDKFIKAISAFRDPMLSGLGRAGMMTATSSMNNNIRFNQTINTNNPNVAKILSEKQFRESMGRLANRFGRRSEIDAFR